MGEKILWGKMAAWLFKIRNGRIGIHYERMRGASLIGRILEKEKSGGKL